MTPTDPALYRRAGDSYLPTSLAGGPWSAEAQHGGPPCALCAHLAERWVEREIGSGVLQPVRLTMDLFRAVPMAPLGARVEVVRRGRRLVLLDVSLLAEGDSVARGSVLFLRSTDVQPYEPLLPPPAGPEALPTVPMISESLRERMPPGFHFEIEVRWVESSARPVAWIRMPLSVVEGSVLSPFERAAGISDFANALGSRARFKGQPVQLGFINTDSTLYLGRQPKGEWLAFEADRVMDRRGVGTVEVAVYDGEGRIGRVVQARLANDRPPGMRDGESVRD